VTASSLAAARPPSLLPGLCQPIRRQPSSHSPTIAAALVDHPTVEILLLGGRIYQHSAVAPYLVLDLDAVTAIVTDAPSTAALDALRNATPAIITAAND